MLTVVDSDLSDQLNDRPSADGWKDGRIYESIEYKVQLAVHMLQGGKESRGGGGGCQRRCKPGCKIGQLRIAWHCHITTTTPDQCA
jgi:hypothetical protein